MKAIRQSIGILLLGLISTQCVAAMAQGYQAAILNRPWSERSENDGSTPVVTEVGYDNAWPILRLKSTSSEAASVDASTPSAFDDASTPSAFDVAESPEAPLLGENCLNGSGSACCHNPCPCFYGSVEALFFFREPRFTRQPIVVDPNTGVTYLSTSSLNFNGSPGISATFGMRLCGGRALEFNYFSLFQGSAFASVISADPDTFLIFPDNFFGNVFVDMDLVQANYSSQLNSFALNLPCCCGCCECVDECGCAELHCQSTEWFVGFRYLNLGERLNIAAQRVVGGQIEEGSYNIRTANNLYGAQLGGRFRRTSGRYGYEATATGGLFGNDAQQTQTVTDFPNFPLRPTVSARSGGLAWVGGANLSALYLLSSVWNVRAGYNLLWIEGLALAPDQLDFNFAGFPSGNQLNHSGGLLLHGLNVGLEARW